MINRIKFKDCQVLQDLTNDPLSSRGDHLYCYIIEYQDNVYYSELVNQFGACIVTSKSIYKEDEDLALYGIFDRVFTKRLIKDYLIYEESLLHLYSRNIRLDKILDNG